MIFHFLIFISSLLLLAKYGFCDSDSCYVEGSSIECDSSHSKPVITKHRNKRYLLYEVNPGEGFNLRRDVYMRMAVLVKRLNEEDLLNTWVLVLPPWGPLYHWKTKDIGFQEQIKWSNFFDIPSLAKYVLVMELDDFLDDHGFKIDVIYYLQHYAEGWTDDRWEERADIRDCIESHPYQKTKNGKIHGWFWGYPDIFSDDFYCLSIQGYSSTLKRFLQTSVASAIMVDRAEVILHDSFGDAEYWRVRRSIGFSKKLIAIGDDFRHKYLNSTDEKDKTVKNYDKQISNFERKAVGGPYIGVHLRRRDFAYARPKEVPSIEHAAKQLLKIMKKNNLQTVFVATDALDSEFKELQVYIPSAIRFVPSKKVHKEILDGGVAIIDQWICAHSRFFIGTFESTFSFRIQEEREILGFPVETTFNRFCGDNQTTCQ
ncbi:GDP-fucose protein O-fucosyltransferase 2, partial [Stegodyphus mimosarum]